MAKDNLPKIIVVIGPTASGKSDLALRLTKLAQGKAFKKAGITSAEIISADSRQVYRGMDIGTGKVLRDKNFPVPNLKFKNQNEKFRDFYSKGIRHYLIDVASPKKQFTASDFKKLGEKAIQEILKNGKIPIVVGGTGFYIDILLGRMQTAEVPPDPKLRRHFDKLSAKHLFSMFRKLDPQRAETIDSHNKRRLVRVLEIVLSTAKPVPPLNPKYLIRNTKYQVLWLGINPSKKKLAERIKKRLDKRFRQGMVQEVNRLHRQGVSWKRLDNFGLEYRWISRYLRNLISKEEMRENLYRDIIKYSKRQMTWFKRNKEINWINNIKTAEKLIRRFMN